MNNIFLNPEEIKAMCAKSDCGLHANSGATRMQVSQEEYILRQKRAWGELPEMTDEQFNEYIRKVREATKRP